MLVNLQVLRAVAAFLVVLVHLRALPVAAGGSADTLDFGNCGVDLFFVISGVIMVVTTNRRETTARSFLWRRLTRIVPFYWAVTAAVIAVAVVAPQLLGATRVSPDEVIKSLAFIPYRKANGLIQPIVFVGWSLNYEMAFYGLFGAGMLLPRRAWGLALSCAALIASTVWGVWTRPQGVIAGFFTSTIILEFAAGMSLGILLPRPPSRGAATAVALPLGAAAMVALVMGSRLWPGLDRLAIVGVPATAVVASALLLERGGVVLGGSMLRRLGAASYAIYLTHFFVTQAMVKLSIRLGVHSTGGVVVMGMASLVLVAIVGLGVHRWVEHPLSDWARRLIVTDPLWRGLTPWRRLPGATRSPVAFAGAGPPLRADMEQHR